MRGHLRHPYSRIWVTHQATDTEPVTARPGASGNSTCSYGISWVHAGERMGGVSVDCVSQHKMILLNYTQACPYVCLNMLWFTSIFELCPWDTGSLWCPSDSWTLVLFPCPQQPTREGRSLTDALWQFKCKRSGSNVYGSKVRVEWLHYVWYVWILCNTLAHINHD